MGLSYCVNIERGGVNIVRFSTIKYSLKRYSRTNQVSFQAQLNKNGSSNCLVSKNTGSVTPLYYCSISNMPISLLHVNYSSSLPLSSCRTRAVPLNRWNRISNTLGFKDGKLVYLTQWDILQGCAKLNKMPIYFEISIDDNGKIAIL